MSFNNILLAYLKDNGSITTLVKKGNTYITCPNGGNHRVPNAAPSAMVVTNGTTSIKCYQCGWKGSVFDFLRLVDVSLANLPDEEINKILISNTPTKLYPELNQYQTWGWPLIKIAKNGKEALDTGWTENPIYDKATWIGWLNRGFNIGMPTGKMSGITVIDVDKFIGEEPEERRNILFTLETCGTLCQQTPSGGRHYLFKYDAEIPQRVNFGDLKIDTRNDGGQIVVAPSEINSVPYKFINSFEDLKEVPPDVKEALLSYTSNKGKEDTSLIFIDDTIGEGLEVPDCGGVKALEEGEGRNNLLLNLGILLSKKYDVQVAADVASLINNTFFSPPLPKKEVLGLLKSLSKYKDKDAEEHERAVYNYCKEVEKDITARDLVDSLKLPRNIIDQCIFRLKQQGVLVRSGVGKYLFKQKMIWTKEFPQRTDQYPHSIKYFNEAENFQYGDLLLIGGQSNSGKTTVALNFIKHIIEQGVTPYYLYLESGSRFNKTSDILGISGKYYHAYCSDPLAIELEPNAFTIIDWLHIGMKEYTDTILKKLADEQQKKGGILLVFTQLKTDNTWFAPNLITQFPTFAARYIQNNENKTEGKWIIDKLKDPKGQYVAYEIPCKFNFHTRVLDPIDVVY